MLSQALKEIGPHQAYSDRVYRIVETQEYAATSSLVNTLEDQDLLEQLLDNVKPAYKAGTEKLHYLISTPFRYPPLQYGSRFGSILVPSFFYASENISTTLAECAYYRFVFLDDIKIPYTKPVRSEHMTFGVNIKTDKMSDVSNIASDEIINRVMSPFDYRFTQQIGQALTQDSDTLVIRFQFIRDKAHKANVAIAEPKAITSKKPLDNMNWICQTTLSTISFNAYGESPVSFSLADFTVDGKLPRPA
tara:strand:- start:1093 stop:1836 length:744 start_codon:yes stop_codon:yes gene_type:complete